MARGPPSSLARPRARPAEDLVKAIRIWKNATQATVVLSLPSRSLGGGPFQPHPLLYSFLFYCAVELDAVYPFGKKYCRTE